MAVLNLTFCAFRSYASRQYRAMCGISRQDAIEPVLKGLLPTPEDNRNGADTGDNPGKALLERVPASVAFQR